MTPEHHFLFCKLLLQNLKHTTVQKGFVHKAISHEDKICQCWSERTPAQALISTSVNTDYRPLLPDALLTERTPSINIQKKRLSLGEKKCRRVGLLLKRDSIWIRCWINTWVWWSQVLVIVYLTVQWFQEVEGHGTGLWLNPFKWRDQSRRLIRRHVYDYKPNGSDFEKTLSVITNITSVHSRWMLWRTWRRVEWGVSLHCGRIWRT